MFLSKILRLRALAKLALCVRTRTGKDLTLQGLLQLRYFDSIFKSLEEVCEWELDEHCQPPRFKKPTRALKLGNALKKAAEVAIALDATVANVETGNRLENYVKLHERE